MTDWKRRHSAALTLPTTQERPIMVLFWVIAELAELHGQDGYLRRSIGGLIDNAADLLNAEWGPRLDMGSLDQMLSDTAERIGYDRELRTFKD